MRFIKHIALSVVFLSSFLTASGRDTLLYHNVGLEFSAGYNLPSHGYYNGYNPLNKPLYANSLVHLKYSFGFQPGTCLGDVYPNVTQGVGVAGCTFYSHQLMGSPFLLYVFQNAQIYRLKPGISIDYAWELGTSYGWRQSGLIATRSNIYINVGLKMSYDVSELITIDIGPEFTHCSNGDTKFPNGGANMFNMKVGVTGHLVKERQSSGRSVIEAYESELKDKSFVKRMHCDLVLFGGYRAGKVVGRKSYTINDPFPFWGLNLMPLYRLNRHFSAGVSVDLLTDRSANIYDVVYDSSTKEILSYSQPDILNQTAVGLTLRGDITMPIFTVGAGFGGFVLPSGNSLRGVYCIFSLKSFMTESLFLNISYRLSARNYTHNMMYGIGWRF